MSLLGGNHASTSGPRSEEPFDVFVNHRGPDVKRTFVKELDEALRAVGVRPFVDVNGIEHGEATWDAILEAIRVAPISICVFSPGYVESKWCLEELAVINESCDKKILPVFYNVKPWQLRRPDKGPFAAGLEKLKSRHEAETVSKWMTWLASTADIYGYELESYSGSEALVQDIVSKVLQHLKSLYPVALDQQAIEIARTIQSQPQKPCRMGIFGMGGIGKTTLVKRIFELLQGDFPVSSFLEDAARETSRGDQGLISLQLKLLRDMDADHVGVEDISDGKSKLRECLLRKQAFIVVDNVDNPSTIDALCLYEHLGVGSCCIVTSRDEQICSTFSPSLKYEMQFLKVGEAKQLFCWHAFGSVFPARGFEEIASEVALACSGHPLTLEIMGSLLKREKDLLVWEAVLEHLRKHDALQNHDKLLVRLQISYDSLESIHKDMFLDVACFLLGSPRHLCKDIWTSLKWPAELGIRNLMNKALLKMDSNSCLTMHDLLIDLGYAIVTSEAALRPGKRRRLWMNESEDELLDGEVSDKVETFSLAESKIDLSNQNLKPMENLRLLNMDGCRGTQIQFPHSVLRYMRWQRLPMEQIPCEMYGMRKLVILDLTWSKITHLWNVDSIAPFPKLQTLYLNNCKALKEIPDSINSCIHLRTMHLEHCSSLESLPGTIGSLSELVNLMLCGCTKLTHLPESMGALSNLRILSLTDCVNLVSLPESIGNCRRLSALWVQRCYNLEGIPESIGRLCNLFSFESPLCDKITHFPDVMRDLSALTYLRLGGTGLSTLPAFIEHLIGLRELTLSLCKFITLPNAICALTSLQILDLVGCDMLETLPEGMGLFQELKVVNLAGCVSLRRLPESMGELSYLEKLNLLCCERLQNLPLNLGKLTSLHIEGCHELVEFPDLSSISSGCALVLYNFLVCRCLQNLEQGKYTRTEEDLIYLMKFKHDDPKLLQIQEFLKEVESRKAILMSMDVEMVRQEVVNCVVQNDMPRALEYINRMVELEPKSEISYLTRYAARQIVNDGKGSLEDIEMVGQVADERKLAGLKLEQHVLDKIDNFRTLWRRDWRGALLALLDFGNNSEIEQWSIRAKSQTLSFPGSQVLGRRTWKEGDDPQPEKAAAMRREALLKFELDDYYGALHLLEEAKALDQHNVETFCLLGRAKRRTGNLQGAADEFAQALRLDPRHDDTLFHRGMLREDVPPFDLQGALDDYSRAIDVNPFKCKCSVFLKARSKVKFKLGDFNGAGEDLDMSYIMYPHSQTMKFKQGLTKWKEGDFEAALADFEVDYTFLPNPCALRYKENLAKSQKEKAKVDF